MEKTKQHRTRLQQKLQMTQRGIALPTPWRGRVTCVLYQTSVRIREIRGSPLLCRRTRAVRTQSVRLVLVLNSTPSFPGFLVSLATYLPRRRALPGFIGLLHTRYKKTVPRELQSVRNC